MFFPVFHQGIDIRVDYAQTAAQCQGQCQAEPTCVAFNWFAPGNESGEDFDNTCWLKSEVGVLLVLRGCYAGPKYC